MAVRWHRLGPFALVPNGDLLTILDRIVCERGPHTIRVTKVRGHVELKAADEERAHVDFAWNRGGDCKADALAGDAFQNLHGPDLVFLAHFLATRHLQYVWLMFAFLLGKVLCMSWFSFPTLLSLTSDQLRISI